MLTFQLMGVSIWTIAIYRVTDILEREMLLCFNLHMTDSGSFSKKRNAGKHGHSSYVVAKTSFVAFYESRTLSI